MGEIPADRSVYVDQPPMVRADFTGEVRGAMRQREEAAIVAATEAELLSGPAAPADDLAVITHLPISRGSSSRCPAAPSTRNGHQSVNGHGTNGASVQAEATEDERLDRDYAQLEQQVQAEPKWLNRYTALVVLADLLGAFVASLIAITAYPPNRDPSAVALFAPTWSVVALFAPAWVAALAAGRTYEHRFVGNGGEEYKRLFHASVVFLAAVGTVAYALHLELTRGVIVVGLPLAMLFSLVVHWVARQGLHRARRRGKCMQRVVVVGLERSVAEIIRTVRREPHAGLEVVAACIDRPRRRERRGRAGSR